MTFQICKSASSINESLNALCTGWRWSHVTGIHFFDPNSGMNPRLSNKLPVDLRTSPTCKFKKLGQIFEVRWNLLLSLSSFTGSIGLMVHHFALGWRISWLDWREIWHRDVRWKESQSFFIFLIFPLSSHLSNMISSKIKLEWHSVQRVHLPRPQSPLQLKFLDLLLSFDPYPNVMRSSLSISPSSHQVLLKSIQ